MSTLLPGFTDTADVRLGSVVFNAYDRNGVAWVVTDIDGWWELPEVSIPDDPRPFEQDGSYLTPGRYMPRVLALNGMLIPPAGVQQFQPTGNPTRNLASYARQALGAAVDIARVAAILQVDEEVPKQAVVQLANKPSFKNSRVNGAIEFSIPLKAPDPRKYSQTLIVSPDTSLVQASGGRTYPRTYPLTYGDVGDTSGPQTGIILATNVGTYNTGAVIRINGPVASPTIEHLELGVVLMFNTSVGSNEYLEIDLFDRTVLLNGETNRRWTMDVRSDWFMLQPGVNSLRFNGEAFGSGASPSMNVTYRSAWIY